MTNHEWNDGFLCGLLLGVIAGAVVAILMGG